MPSPVTFDEVLDAIEHLPPEQQADLLQVVQRRLAERGRECIVEDVRQGRDEFTSGATKPASAEDIAREIGS